MKLVCRYLLAGLVSVGMTGCTFVHANRRPATRRPAEVTVYNVYTSPHEAARAVGGPPAHAPAHGWRSKNRYYFYPSCQVYYSPQRNCYIWRGPRGWVVTPKPPEKVLLMADEAVTVELDGDASEVNRSEISVRHGEPGESGPATGTTKDSPGRGDSRRDEADEDERGNLPDKYRPNDKEKGKDKPKDDDKAKAKGQDADKDQGKVKDEGQDTDQPEPAPDQGKNGGNDQGKGKDKDKDKEKDSSKGNSNSGSKGNNGKGKGNGKG